MRTTSSSISSSESPPGIPAGQAKRWEGFCRAFAAGFVLVFGVLLGTLVLLDPYDTGRFLPFNLPGVAKQGPRTANASRGRNAAFDSAIIGNSHVQLIQPEHLSAETGFNFVSLMVPATYPKEQSVMIDWFLRHHPAPRGLVFGLDQTWCLDRIFNEKPFPFWLYERNALAYLAGLVRFTALERLPGRLAVLFRRAKPARPDGFWDYDADYRAIGYGDPAVVAQKLAGERPILPYNPSSRFPAAERMKAILAALPASTAVVLVWPPVFISGQPQPGTSAETMVQACHKAYADLAAARPRTAVVDWATDRPENRLAEHFFDKTHYRHSLAIPLTADLGAAFRRLQADAR